MVLTPNLESANNADFLWPPIADALDTFLRRRSGTADAFERVWRLIHLWEGIGITLAVSSMARMCQSDGDQEVLRRQREFFYGKSWDPVTESFKEIQGAADGAIDQWINILDEIAKAPSLPSRFLSALQTFLKAEAIDIAPLVTAWAKACDVPSDFQERGTVGVRVAMRYVNSFRNRFAHVPFPHDPLADVSEALEAATEQLFSVPPLPSAHEKGGQSNPLTGALRSGACFLRGGQLESLQQAEPCSLQFVFPCQRRGDIELWPVNDLVYIDPMMRPHILTRVKDLDVCEYTRFRAEANAVVVLPDARVSSYLPEPEKAEYPREKPVAVEEPATERREIGMPEALEAIRSGDFDTGIEFFASLVEQRPDYHVGWLRLGHARREKAVRLADSQPEAALLLLRDALGDLAKAEQHIDPAYKAVAHYERSKTYYRIAQLDRGDEDSRKLARDEAAEARKLSTERKYQNWWDYLETYAPWVAQSGV